MTRTVNITRRRPARTLTVFAVGFLALDGVLLILAGLWSRHGWLVLWGVFFVVCAGVPVFAWRRYLRNLDEIREARAEMRHEIELLRNELKDGRLGPPHYS